MFWIRRVGIVALMVFIFLACGASRYPGWDDSKGSPGGWSCTCSGDMSGIEPMSQGPRAVFGFHAVEAAGGYESSQDPLAPAYWASWENVFYLVDGSLCWTLQSAAFILFF
jgi:hypothetical protein